MWHLIPAFVCGVTAAYAAEATWDAWRDAGRDRDRFDVAWPVFATAAALLSAAGAGISLWHVVARWLA